jgi:hypothetical protein
MQTGIAPADDVNQPDGFLVRLYVKVLVVVTNESARSVMVVMVDTPTAERRRTILAPFLLLLSKEAYFDRTKKSRR